MNIQGKKMSISIDYQLKMMESIAHIMEKIDEKESGKFTKEQINEDLKGVLSDLKSLATKAQKQWEKTRKSSKRENVDLSIEEAKSKFDNPPVDYGGYDLEDPNAKYAARHFKPTDSAKERKKREIQAHIEKLLRRAPSSWVEKTEWRIVPLEGDKMSFYDEKADQYYAYPSGRKLSKRDIYMGVKSDEELEDLLKTGKAKRVDDKIVVTTMESSSWLTLLLGFLAILLKVVFLIT